MDLSTYFEPVSLDQLYKEQDPSLNRFKDKMCIYTHSEAFPSLDNIDVVIFGVMEGRGALKNEGCRKGADEVRRKLYPLYVHEEKVCIADLGNIMEGSTVTDTYFAVQEVLSFLFKKRIMPIILGGGHDLTWATYKAYEKIGQIINLFCVDSMLDIGETPGVLNSQSFLNHIILSQPNYLFNFTNIGYQSYFVNPEAVHLMDELYFDTYRLGTVREKLNDVEPLVRNADAVSIDISAIRQSDAPGNGNPSPHGFYGEELCRIAYFAGMSDKVSSIGFYEYNPAHDHQYQTAHLIAHAIWYFVKGFYNRKYDSPYKDKQNCKKYIVPLKNNTLDIVFYKSKKSDRWWMEIPCNEEFRNKYNRHFIVPCTYSDYEMALEDEIPERFWRFYQKLMV